MTEKTIKELAEEFQVSKQAIRKKLTADFRANYVQTVTRNGVQTLVVSEKGYTLLKQGFLGGNHTANQVQTVTGNPANQDMAFSVLYEQLKEKDEQLKQLQKLLDQQQQLTLQANQQIEQLQNQLQLNTPPSDWTEAEEPSKKESSVTKNWWDFFRRN